MGHRDGQTSITELRNRISKYAYEVDDAYKYRGERKKLTADYVTTIYQDVTEFIELLEEIAYLLLDQEYEKDLYDDLKSLVNELGRITDICNGALDHYEADKMVKYRRVLRRDLRPSLNALLDDMEVLDHDLVIEVQHDVSRDSQQERSIQPSKY